LITALAVPAAAQNPTTQPGTATPSTTQTDTTKKGTTVNTSNGAIADTIATAPTTPSTTMPAPAAATPPTGQTTPTTSAAKVEVKVAESLASTAKVSADSAFALAKAQSENGEISSADLEMKDGRLVYQVNLLLKNKGAERVYVDAMTGQVVKDKKLGGVKAIVEHHEENKKLLDAKRDSSGMKKP
jgi:uncharacterized membrane protein YkoI